jgi:hypothetical protein
MFGAFYGRDSAALRRIALFCYKVFYFFIFLIFCNVINLKNKPYLSMLDGMPMVDAIFLAREDLGSKPMS